MLKLFKNKNNKILSLKEFNERKNKILIKRRCGGIGDIVVQRMLFEDFSKIKGIKTSYACPYQYLDFVNDNEFVECLDIQNIQEEKYGAIYDITTACRVYENMKGANNTKNRSDIWAEHCGVNLENHNMNFKINKKSEDSVRQIIRKRNVKNLPVLCLCTKSHSQGIGESKSLLDHQTQFIINYLKDKFYIFTIHSDYQEIYSKNNIDQFIGISAKDWIAYLNESNFVISIDSATFHIAGGLKKPLMGIFTFANGKVYGKYFDFILVQKHRDNGDWDCGPCFNMHLCHKTSCPLKPCLTTISHDDLKEGIDKAVKKWSLLENDQTIE